MPTYSDIGEDVPDSVVFDRVRRRQHILRRTWWRIVGMPDADVLRDRYGREFTDAEEERIREIVREES